MVLVIVSIVNVVTEMMIAMMTLTKKRKRVQFFDILKSELQRIFDSGLMQCCDCAQHEFMIEIVFRNMFFDVFSSINAAFLEIWGVSGWVGY